MLPASLSLIPSFSLTGRFPPKAPVSPSPLSRDDQPQLHCPSLGINLFRREAFLFPFIAVVPSLQFPAPANAFSFGISGPKDWLRQQKKKSAKFLLAPVDASRSGLRAAYLLLSNGNSDYGDGDLEDVHKLLKSAARDCIPQERNSFVAFQSSIGVEVCTFRLIVKNASSLLDDKDPIKLEAEADLSDLIRSFTSLNDMANDTNIQLISDRQKVADALMDTISSLDQFEQDKGLPILWYSHDITS